MISVNIFHTPTEIFCHTRFPHSRCLYFGCAKLGATKRATWPKVWRVQNCILALSFLSQTREYFWLGKVIVVCHHSHCLILGLSTPPDSIPENEKLIELPLLFDGELFPLTPLVFTLACDRAETLALSPLGTKQQTGSLPDV